MKIKALLLHLVEHSQWANHQILESLTRTSSKDALELLAHIVTTEQVYYDRITGGEPWPLEFWPRLSPDQITALIVENHQNYRGLLETTTEKKLSDKVQYKNSKGTVYHTIISEMIIHIGLHGQHHRGQIARLIRSEGGEPPVTDYIWYTRLRE